MALASREPNATAPRCCYTTGHVAVQHFSFCCDARFWSSCNVSANLRLSAKKKKKKQWVKRDQKETRVSLSLSLPSLSRLSGKNRLSEIKKQHTLVSISLSRSLAPCIFVYTLITYLFFLLIFLYKCVCFFTANLPQTSL